jgi:protein tyrosine/serine phosphatase
VAQRPHPSRHLTWDRCFNVRDLGGHAGSGGQPTAQGALVRADTLDHLTSSGWEALVAHGARTIVDLRSSGERRSRPLPAGVEERHVPLLEAADFAALDGVATMQELYLAMLERRPGAFAAAVTAVADAPAGGVVVHCFAGKDRTGLVVALALLLAGVAADAVADDYADSDNRVRPLLAEWVSTAPTAGERARRLRESRARRETMVQTLELIETRFGGAEQYLLGAGASAEVLTGLRLRLLIPPEV